MGGRRRARGARERLFRVGGDAGPPCNVFAYHGQHGSTAAAIAANDDCVPLATHSGGSHAPDSPDFTRRARPVSKKSSQSRRPLRSTKWFGRHDRDGLVHRSWMKNQGIPHDQFDGRPVIGICNTWSQATPCIAHVLRELAEMRVADRKSTRLNSSHSQISYAVFCLKQQNTN